MPAEMSRVLRDWMIFQACGAKLAVDAMAATEPMTVTRSTPVQLRAASGVPARLWARGQGAGFTLPIGERIG